MQLMSLSAFAEQLGKKANLFNVQAFDYKKVHGVYPKWFIHSPIRNETMIDCNLYMRRIELPKIASLYATNKLYWIFVATGHTNSDISRIMVKRSKYFKSVKTWNTFFSSGLFKGASQAIIEPTLLTEFVKVGTKYLYLLRKWDKLDLSKEFDYYD